MTKQLSRSLWAAGSLALLVLGACNGGDDGSSSSTADTTAVSSDGSVESTLPDTSAATSEPEDTVVTSEPVGSVPTPTLAQEIPDEELPARILEVFTTNSGDAEFAQCLQTEVLAGIEAGDIAYIDVDNYVRGVTTDDMTAFLLELQSAATCTKSS